MHHARNRVLMPRKAMLAGAAGLLILTSCSFGLGNGAASAAPSGYVVGDEPFAVKVGADMLSQGGSAADAVAAMYFMLSVTYPSAAGLGGGGVCVVHDGPSGQTETFDFLARDGAAGGPFAVPGNVAGFSMMQAMFGRLAWQRVVSPGERMAASGFPITRALSERLAGTQDVIRLDAGLAAEFFDEAGQLKAAGSIATNRDLATTLAAVRIDGRKGFYQGAITDKIVAYSTAQSGAIGAGELGAYAADTGEPQIQRAGSQVAYFPPAHLGAGAFARLLAARLVSGSGDDKGAVDGHTLIAETTKTLVDLGIKSLPQDLGATGFAATDASGQAVACAVTMNGPFGSGHTVTGTGITLARAPASGSAGLAAAFLTPVVVTDGESGPVTFAGAGAGGPNGAALIVFALLKLAAGEDMTVRSNLRSTGAAPYDTVNAIACQNEFCATLPDPGANGLGAAAPQPAD
jgi:gamma-glutamyltranspeptidase / glutathione hydrolase